MSIFYGARDIIDMPAPHRPRRLARARAMRLFETVVTVIAVGLALGVIVYGVLA